MSDVIITYQWEILIILEVLATICLIAFLVSRYALRKICSVVCFYLYFLIVLD